ncbi:MAG: 30S ribosomal protein S9 [Patescibacteria group bacterium]
MSSSSASTPKKIARKPATRRTPAPKYTRTEKAIPVVRHVTPKAHHELKSATPKAEQSEKRFFYAVGRRKESIVGVRLYFTQPAAFKVNGKDLEKYFSYPLYEALGHAPLGAVGLEGKVSVIARAQGGGKHGQAVALRMAVSRALVVYDEQLRPTLRAHGYLTRDPRAKERKKYGLKRARRAPQWQKR